MIKIILLAICTLALTYGCCSVLALDADPREWPLALQVVASLWGLVLILFWAGVGMVARLPLEDDIQG